MTSPPSADVVVVGAGLVGLACAAAIAERGGNVALVGEPRQGEASPAAAGMLAPTVERARGAAHAFAVASRDRYPTYVAWLAERTGVEVALNRLGVLVVALEPADDVRLLAGLDGSGAQRLSGRELAEIEPALARASSAALCPDDGAVDNLALLDALRAVVRGHPRVRLVEEWVTGIAAARGRVAASTQTGSRLEAPRLVLAGGAWTPELAGLPRPVPVAPVRGQMLALAGAPLRHVTYGPDGYLVPRADGRTLAGATMEHAAFDARTTPEGVAGLRAAAERLCPALAGAATLSAWAGLRPMTPDLLPIIGPDPARPEVLFACGHSRNGILMAPLTGDCIAALAAGADAPADLSPFSIARFAGRDDA